MANNPVKYDSLGIVSEMTCADAENKIYAHVSLGLSIDALAQYCSKVLLCAPIRNAAHGTYMDYAVKAENIELCPQPPYRSSLEALGKPWQIIKAYNRLMKKADCVFVRGMIPYVFAFYLLARWHGIKPVHQIVGNPVALLQSHKRAGSVKDSLSLLYAYQDRFFTRLGRWWTNGALLCNGNELAEIYSSPRTTPIVSSTISEKEFSVREDTCQNDVVRLIYVGFVRPEKGLEYLFEALAKLRTSRKWSLTVVGPWSDHIKYKEKLDAIADGHNVSAGILWKGYISYGPEMWECLRQHDIFILPSLSEGTPRVLLEARANSLPVVATNVGGIPTSVNSGIDGLLVPPKNAAAIADAIDRIIENDQLRQQLISEGLRTAKKYTIEAYVGKIIEELQV